MAISIGLLKFIAIYMICNFTHAYVSIPFTHDFNTGLYGWVVDGETWKWTANLGQTMNTTKFRSFHSDGYFIWTQKGKTQQTIYSDIVMDVTKDTRFNITFWLASAADGDWFGEWFYYNCEFITVYLEGDYEFTKTAYKSFKTDNWEDLIIDCQIDKCCQRYDCDLRIYIDGSTECMSGVGLIAIKSVSATKSLTSTILSWILYYKHYIYPPLILAALILAARRYRH